MNRLARHAPGVWRHWRAALPFVLLPASIVLATFCLIANKLAAAMVGLTLVAFSHSAMVPIMAGVTTFGGDVKPFTLPPFSKALLTAFAAGLCWTVFAPGDRSAAVDVAGVLCALLLAIGATARLLVAVGVETLLCRAVVMTGSLAWLTWPVWLSSAPAGLVRAHPLLALNGVLAPDLGVWTELPVAYHLTSLGQDVPYALPDSPWFCVGTHLLLAALLGGSATILTRVNRRRRTRSLPGDTTVSEAVA